MDEATKVVFLRICGALAGVLEGSKSSTIEQFCGMLRTPIQDHTDADREATALLTSLQTDFRRG